MGFNMKKKYIISLLLSLVMFSGVVGAETFDYLEELYATYKRSVPDTIKYKHKYFKALTSQQMTLKDLVTGANRQKAKEQLEMAILTGVINGSLKWPDDSKWFWQSEKDKDFVLLKKWIVHQT